MAMLVYPSIKKTYKGHSLNNFDAVMGLLRCLQLNKIGNIHLVIMQKSHQPP